jgi:hypothetical protein
MFKPNIRGFSKAQLRFTLFGWRLREKPESMILHRFPWRRSWLKQLERYPEAQPALSRLGRTHLVVELKERPIRTIPKYLVIAVALLVILFISSIGQAESPSNQDRLTISRPEPDAPINIASNKCPMADNDYVEVIADWLGNRDISPISISQESQLQIGGVRSTVVLVSCQSNQKRYRITEVMQKGTWEIETAQLAN